MFFRPICGQNQYRTGICRFFFAGVCIADSGVDSLAQRSSTHQKLSRRKKYKMLPEKPELGYLSGAVP